MGYGVAKPVGPKLSIIYKIMSQQQWEEAQAKGQFEGSEVDAKDGFIHLSAVHQVRATAEKHFAGQRDLVLVYVQEESLGADLKWEVSRGGDLFPHYYGTLSLLAVARAVPLPLVNGIHQLAGVFPE